MNAAMWSLSVEFQFYMTVTILAFALGVLRITPRLRDRFVLCTSLAILMMGIFARISLESGRGIFFAYIRPVAKVGPPVSGVRRVLTGGVSLT